MNIYKLGKTKEFQFIFFLLLGSRISRALLFGFCNFYFYFYFENFYLYFYFYFYLYFYFDICILYSYLSLGVEGLDNFDFDRDFRLWDSFNLLFELFNLRLLFKCEFEVFLTLVSKGVSWSCYKVLLKLYRFEKRLSKFWLCFRWFKLSKSWHIDVLLEFKRLLILDIVSIFLLGSVSLWFYFFPKWLLWESFFEK